MVVVANVLGHVILWLFSRTLLWGLLLVALATRLDMLLDVRDHGVEFVAGRRNGCGLLHFGRFFGPALELLPHGEHVGAMNNV